VVGRGAAAVGWLALPAVGWAGAVGWAAGGAVRCGVGEATMMIGGGLLLCPGSPQAASSMAASAMNRNMR
jgi:hypothetical protein